MSKMAKKGIKPKPKSNFLGFRLSEKTFKNLELLAKQEGKSRGIIAKDAIKQWLNISQMNQTNEMIVITKSLFIQLFQNTDIHKMEDLAEKTADFFSSLITFHITMPIENTNTKEFAKYCISRFGKSGLKWFNTIDFEIEENKLILRGLHDLGENFSGFFLLFFKCLISKILDFKVIEEAQQLMSNLVYAEFKLMPESK